MQEFQTCNIKKSYFLSILVSDLMVLSYCYNNLVWMMTVSTLLAFTYQVGTNILVHCVDVTYVLATFSNQVSTILLCEDHINVYTLTEFEK